MENINEDIELGFYLNYLFESEILNAGIVDSKIIPAYKKNISLIKKFLVSYHVPLNKVESQARDVYHKLESKMLKREEPTEVASWLNIQLIDIVSTLLGPITKQFKLSEKVSRAISMTLLVIVAQLLVNMLVGGPLLSGLGMGGSAVGAFMAIVVAPITEEALKKIGILEGYPFILTGVFSGIEAIEYIIMIVATGGSLASAIALRALALSFHFFTMLVQKYFHKKGVELQSSKLDTIGYIIAVCMHATWNTMAVINA